MDYLIEIVVADVRVIHQEARKLIWRAGSDIHSSSITVDQTLA
jgi:hypothetical protein